MKRIQRKLRNGKEKIRRALSNTRGEVSSKLKGIQHNIIAYAKKNPIKTVGLSVLAGVILSQVRRLRK